MKHLVALFGPAVRSRNYRPDIEGLRGIAILSVVLYHVGLDTFGGGFVGVDVFFVLSGYLITGLLVREIDQRQTLSLARFYARRSLRLLPASVVMVIAASVVLARTAEPLNQLLFSETAVSSSVYLSNMWFNQAAGDYFARGTAANPFLHTWSLAVEEQFYFVWPLLFLGIMRVTRSHRGLAYGLAILGAVSFGVSVWFTAVHPPVAFYVMPARAWEFAAGGLLVLYRPAERPQSDRAIQMFGLVGLGLVLLSVTQLDQYSWFPGPAALLPTVGTLGILLSGALSPDSGVPRLLSARPLQVLGRLSYSWYLWHWPVLIIGADVLGVESVVTRLLLVVGALVISIVGHLLVENPIRHNQWLRARPKPVLVGSLAVTAALASGVWGWNQGVQATLALPEYRSALFASQDVPEVFGTRCVGNITLREAHECRYGSEASNFTVVLLGDSHAGQWFPAIRRIAEDEGWRLVTLLKQSCAVSDVPVYHTRLNRWYTECAEWREAAIERVHALQPALVVLSQYAVVYADGAGVGEARWEAGTREILNRLSAPERTLVLLRDSPRPGYAVPDCLANAIFEGRAPSECDIPSAVALRPSLAERERAAVDGIPGAWYLDLSRLFCGPDVCPAQEGGLVRYQDSNHLTATYARSLVEPVRDGIFEALQARLTTGGDAQATSPNISQP